MSKSYNILKFMENDKNSKFTVKNMDLEDIPRVLHLIRALERKRNPKNPEI